MNEEIKNLMGIIESLESRVNSYWNFYIVIIVATGGWLMSSTEPFSQSQGVVLIIALSLFFIANFSVLNSATKRVVALDAELNVLASLTKFNSVELRNNLVNPAIQYRLVLSYILHVVLDLAVMYAIWSKLGEPCKLV